MSKCGFYWRGDALYLDLRAIGEGRKKFGRVTVQKKEARLKLEMLAEARLKELTEQFESNQLFDNNEKIYPTYKQMALFFWDKYWSVRPYFASGYTFSSSDHNKLHMAIAFLGAYRANEITREQVKAFRMDLRKQHPTWSGAYINRIIAMIGQVYRFCITQEIYQFKDASHAEREKYGYVDNCTNCINPILGFPRLPEEPNPTKTITIEQFKTLLEVVEGEYRHYMLIAAHTGMRKRNITWLRVDEVNTFTGVISPKDHKGVSKLTHQMHPDLVQLFKVLTPYNETYWFSRRFNYDKWREWTRKAEVEGFEPFKGMRASYTTWRVEEGAALSLLEAALGHSTPVITQKHYNKAHEASKLLLEKQRSVIW